MMGKKQKAHIWNGKTKIWIKLSNSPNYFAISQVKKYAWSNLLFINYLFFASFKLI